MLPRTRWLLLYLLTEIVEVMGLWRCSRAYDVNVVFGAFFLSSFSELSASKNDMPVGTRTRVHVLYYNISTWETNESRAEVKDFMETFCLARVFSDKVVECVRVQKLPAMRGCRGMKTALVFSFIYFRTKRGHRLGPSTDVPFVG